MSAVAAGGAARRAHVPLWLLALVTFSGTLGMHIFVPALPAAGAALGASMGVMQMTVSLYIVGLAAGQLVYGPLADSFGRRPVLLGGLALYTGAGLAAALAPQVHALIAARLFQAIGGCAGLVLGRTIVRDTAAPGEAARRLALMNLMVTLGPSLAPLLGGAMVSALGWRSVFGVLFVLGLAGWILTWRLLPETVRPASPGRASSLGRDYRQLLGSRIFLAYAVGGGCATTAVYAFIASAPFIFVEQLHRPAHEAGVYLAVLVSGAWLGSVLASRLVSRVDMQRLLVRANAVSVLGAFTFLAVVLSGHLSVVATIVPMFVFTVGAGVASPAALTKAIGVNPRVIGSASGLYGFAQMTVGAVCTALAGLGSNPALASALVLAAVGVVSQAAFWVTSRGQGTAGCAA